MVMTEQERVVSFFAAFHAGGVKEAQFAESMMKRTQKGVEIDMSSLLKDWPLIEIRTSA